MLIFWNSAVLFSNGYNVRIMFLPFQTSAISSRYYVCDRVSKKFRNPLFSGKQQSELITELNCKLQMEHLILYVLGTVVNSSTRPRRHIQSCVVSTPVLRPCKLFQMGCHATGCYTYTTRSVNSATLMTAMMSVRSHPQLAQLAEVRS